MSRTFRFLVGARDRLYENGVLPTYRLNHPVISVGNLTVGGTGKTPLVILLSQRFRDAGFRPVVLSRGYKRKSAGIVVVSRGSGPTVSWEIAGDEPFLIAQRAHGVSVVVGADRYGAGTVAEQENLGDLFILDDGFQHRRLKRDLDIVLIDAMCPFGYGHVLPRGLLREPLSGLRRANLLAITRSDQVGRSELERIEATMRQHNPSAPVIRLRTQVVGVETLSGASLDLGRGGARVLAAFPGAEITFAPHEKRQRIVDSWPADVDDSAARRDWGFAPRYDEVRAFSEYLVPMIKERYSR